MKKRITAALPVLLQLIILPLLHATQSAPPISMLLDGTPVHMVLMDDLSDNKAKVGDAVRFKVRENVVVHGHIVIVTGTVATGHVTKISKSGLFGKSGNITLHIDAVSAADGTPIRLRGAPGVAGGKGGALTAVSATWFGPDARMAVGTMMNAFVDGDQAVPASSATAFASQN
jgi:hypothetical protein